MIKEHTHCHINEEAYMYNINRMFYWSCINKQTKTRKLQTDPKLNLFIWLKIQSLMKEVKKERKNKNKRIESLHISFTPPAKGSWGENWKYKIQKQVKKKKEKKIVRFLDDLRNRIQSNHRTASLLGEGNFVAYMFHRIYRHLRSYQTFI